MRRHHFWPLQHLRARTRDCLKSRSGTIRASNLTGTWSPERPKRSCFVLSGGLVSVPTGLFRQSLVLLNDSRPTRSQPARVRRNAPGTFSSQAQDQRLRRCSLLPPANGSTAFLPQLRSLAHNAPNNTALDKNKPIASTNAPVSKQTTEPTKAANIAKKITGQSTLLADVCTAPTISKSTAFALLLRCARLLRARRLLRVCRLPTLTPRHRWPPLLPPR
jgi:hypothetical protein